jgi:tellurite resistance protein TerC
VISLKEAARWSVIVVIAAAIFDFFIFKERGSRAGLEFVTGYLIELALSVDNVFVFILIFKYFRVPAQHQHQVLFWGIFGAFLVVTGVKMAFQDDAKVEPEHNPFLKLLRRFMPISHSYDGQRFFTVQEVGGKLRRLATPMLVVLVMVETTDVLFALDSIPAIFAITRDPFLIFTSNAFAILGLRSLYFLLAGVIERFHFLNYGLAAVLSFVGVKMLITYFHIDIPIGISLAIVGGLLGISVAASLIFPQAPELQEGTPPEAR